LSASYIWSNHGWPMGHTPEGGFRNRFWLSKVFGSHYSASDTEM
jgi:hypothetical protein